MMSLVTSLVLVTLAQSGALSVPPPPPPPTVEQPMPRHPPDVLMPEPGDDPLPRPTRPLSEKSFGLYLGVNLALIGVELQVGRFYGFVAGNIGIPLVTNGGLGAAVLGLGYNVPLSAPGESMWFMDFYGEALPGWVSVYRYDTPYGAQGTPFVGLGIGVGFRFLHRSGFTLGFKVPIFGLAVGPGAGGVGNTGLAPTGSQLVGTYYLANLIALPIVSLGFRF